MLYPYTKSNAGYNEWMHHKKSANELFTISTESIHKYFVALASIVR